MTTHTASTLTMHPKVMNSSGNPLKVRKGGWEPEEDTLLRKYIEMHGEGKWHLVSKRSGLSRCRKSCRLRWLNYLRPTIKRGDFDEDEVDLMMRLHRLLGNRWTLIAGRLPGRTGNDVKNFWNSNIKKKLTPASKEKEVMVEAEDLVQRQKHMSSPPSDPGEPLPLTVVSQDRNLPCHNLIHHKHMSSPPSDPGDGKFNNISILINKPPAQAASLPDDDGIEWWSSLLEEEASLNEWGHLDEPVPPAKEAIGLLEENGQSNICWTDDIWNLLNYDYC